MKRAQVMKLVSACLMVAASHTVQAAAQAKEGAVIRHLPLNEVELADARFAFEVTSPDRAGHIVVRTVSDAPPHRAVALRAERLGAGYLAVLPAADVALPGFSYYVAEQLPDGSERPVFADAASPHHVRVRRSDAAQTEHERLQAHDGRRSIVSLSAEGVDYGDRKLAAAEPSFHDRYYRLSIGYAYSFFSTIEDVRLSLLRVRGQAASYDGLLLPHSSALSPGIDYGRAAVTLVAHQSVRLRGAALLGASQRGFEYGAGASLVIGDPLGTSFDVGVEGLTTLGTTTHVRLGFLASRDIPMGTTLEVSSFPVGEDSGVRLLYDVGYRFSPVTTLTLRGGYQARTSVSGGPSLGVGFDYGF